MGSNAFRPGPFHPDRPTLVAPVRVDPQGIIGPTRRQARGAAWRRTGQGFYVPAAVPLGVEQRIVEAAASMPPAGGVTGWAALRWYGGAWFDGRSPDGRQQLPVVLASCQDDIREQAGMTLCQERLNPAEVVAVDGLRVTVPERSVCFEMRYAANEREAAVCFDMAAYNDIVSIKEVAAYAMAHPGWTGIPQARKALALVDENSWSPWESRMLHIWVLDAQLPRPLCNQPIFDLRGRHIGTPDLFDPEKGVAGEFDSTLHPSGAQRARDVRREGLFRGHGLEYFTVLAGDIGHRQLVAQRMIDTRERAPDIAQSRRTWTLTPPPWWIESNTVEQRRALTGYAREMVLRHRCKVA